MSKNLVPAQKIGIDCRLLGRKHAGIGRYIENLLKEIPNCNNSNAFNWVFFFYDKAQWNEFLENTPHLDFFQNQQVIFAPFRHYSLQEQLKMPGIFAKQELNLLHVPHFNIPLIYSGKIVVTIHDLLWHEYRGSQVTTLSPWKYWIKHNLYRVVVAQAVRRSIKIFVPTQTIAQTITRYFPASQSKIVVAYEGVEHVFLETEDVHSMPTSQIKSLIYVGSLYPHKNVEIILQALLHSDHFELHIVGARNVFQETLQKRVQELKLDKKVIFHGYVEDKELKKIFSKCFALIQPSLFEGFGLTGIEAMASGLPVVASDIPIFKEVYKDKAIFFSPTHVESLIAALEKLEHPETYKKFTHFHKEIEQQYSWSKMTQQILNFYQKTLTV